MLRWNFLLSTNPGQQFLEIFGKVENWKITKKWHYTHFNIELLANHDFAVGKFWKILPNVGKSKRYKKITLNSFQHDISRWTRIWVRKLWKNFEYPENGENPKKLIILILKLNFLLNTTSPLENLEKFCQTSENKKSGSENFGKTREGQILRNYKKLH